VIRTFADKRSKAVFENERVKRLPREVTVVAQRKMYRIHTAGQLEDLTVPPGNRLERLRGDRNGQHSIRINDQWRICFRWEDGHAYDVEIVDYHG